VVGVVGDVRVRGFEQTSEPQVYVPSGQVDDDAIVGYLPQELVIRSTLPPEQWLHAVRRIIAAADPEQPVSDVRPVAKIIANQTAPRRVQLRVLGILSAIALLIAGVGVHGLLSFTVLQRTKELGIRRALGAPAGGIIAMVLRDGLKLFAAGAALGVIVALLAGRGMSALLFGVPPTDPATIATAVAVCFVTALAGCLRPALRAARVDPMFALREN
jgi:ABC-type antimicrobial peptide transport system permease subunit